MPYNLNNCILFSSPSVPCRKKTAAPVYCPTALSKFKSNRQTTCFKAQTSRNLSTLWSKSANDSASPASGTAFRFSSMQMQTSASLSPRSLWYLTKDFRGCCSSTRQRFWLTSSEWERGKYHTEEMRRKRGGVRWRGGQRLCQMFSSEMGCLCVRSCSPWTSPPLEDDRVLGRGVRCRSQGTTQDFKAEVILNPCYSARLNSASSVLSEVLTLWTLL